MTQNDWLDNVAAVIRKHYGVGWVDRPEVLPGTHQRRHRKVVVNTGLGRFLAKTYSNDPYVLDALRFQHRLSDFLKSNDLPVASIQPAANGRRIVEFDTWAMELQEFVEGEPMEVSKETLAISAQALGRFHTCCKDFPRPERDGRLWRFSEVPRELFAHLYRLAKEQDASSKVDDECNQIALFLKDANQALSYEERNRFELGLIHGDWHSGNLIFEGERLKAILDLEFAGDGCFLEDLAYAVSNLAIRTTTKIDRLAKRTDALLDSYQKHRTLSFYEEAALYYAIGIKHIATVSYQVQQHGGLVAGFPAHEWMERLAFQCGWLGERAQRVRWGQR